MIPLLDLSYDRKATKCLKGGCQQSTYCASCTESNRIYHRHPYSMYIVTLKRKRDIPVTRVVCAHCKLSKSPSLYPPSLAEDSSSSSAIAYPMSLN